MTDPEEIKKAIKEAMDDKTLADLSKQMTDLATQMTQGFAETHTKQNITNGKVLNNTADIVKINEFIAQQTKITSQKEANFDRYKWLTMENIFKAIFTLAIGWLLYLARLK